MPTGRPFGPLPHLPVEMPNHKAVIVPCCGTVTAMRITKSSLGWTRYLCTWPSLRSTAATPLMVGVNVTFGASPGHGMLAQDGDEEHPPAARAIRRRAAPRTPHQVRLTLLRRAAWAAGCVQQAASSNASSNTAALHQTAAPRITHTIAATAWLLEFSITVRARRPRLATRFGWPPDDLG
jgi:hypothetical protein